MCGGIGGSASASRFLHPSPHKVVVERGGNVEWTHTHHEYMDRGTFRGKGGKVTKNRQNQHNHNRRVRLRASRHRLGLL